MGEEIIHLLIRQRSQTGLLKGHQLDFQQFSVGFLDLLQNHLNDTVTDHNTYLRHTSKELGTELKHLQIGRPAH